MIKSSGSSVSVLMPVYNGEQYLYEAIKSILSQTYSNWELIIADDGSTDSSAEIAATFAASDPRIKVTTFPHRGLVATLNSAMRLCSGRYVFRMDADDVALPRRLECQTRYLDSHPETVVLGCAVTSGRKALPSWLIPRSPLECKWQLVFRNCVGHPGVAIRASAVAMLPPYRSEYFLAEDFKLWSELSLIGAVHVLSEPLLFYRKHAGSVSSKHYAEQVRVDRRIVVENIRSHLGIDVSCIAGLPPRQWAFQLVDFVICSSFYKNASPTDRNALRRALEIYIARYGLPPLVRLMYRTRFRDTIRQPALTAVNLVRSFKARALMERR